MAPREQRRASEPGRTDVFGYELPYRLSRLDPHGDVLRLEVLPDALEAALAAEAGLLDAAEGRGGVGHDALVEADHAGLDLLADAEGASEVAREDVGHETVLGAVGRLD